MAHLFAPIALGELALANRIVVSPMCQYSAEDGTANDWHFIHHGQLALSGAGLAMIEATAVERVGHITHGCLGLYSDANEAALARIVALYRQFGGATRLGMQIGHSGRKGSSEVPWRGGKPLTAAQGAWDIVAPSAVPIGPDYPVPHELTLPEMARIRDAFVATARRAARLGIELLELHAAHGYLLHSFYSPLSNRRGDRYGGSLENRLRFPLEIAAAVREVWPRGRPMGARITGSDWIEGGWTPDDAVTFARKLKELGADFVCVSSGGIDPTVKIPLKPGYQTPFAAQVRREAKLPVQTVGLITDPDHAERIVASGQADMVALARGFLDNPRWVWHAADRLGAPIAYPPQYDRAEPSRWPGARQVRPRQMEDA